jgi:hypothetical protein
MKQTTTKTELSGVKDRFNQSIKDTGYCIEIGHRNGYTAIDLMNQDGGMINYLDTFPSDKQALNALYLMCKAVDLIHNPRK